MSDDSLRESLDKAIKIMRKKLDDLDSKESIDNADVWPLTQIAKALSTIDKQLKDYPEDDDEFSKMTDEELREKALAAASKYK